MVFGAHILGGTAEHIYDDKPDYVSFVEIPWSFGVYGVNLFFVISGFVIWGSVVRYSPVEFEMRRFIRIYPLFFASTIIFAALNAVTNAYPKVNDPISFISALLFIDLFVGTEQLAPNAWSLSYEVAYYVLTCLTFHFALRKRSVPLGFLAAALSLAFIVAFPITFYFVGGLLIRILYDRGIGVPRPLPGRVLEVTFGALAIWTSSLGHIEYTWERMAEPLVVLRVITTLLYFHFAVQEGSLTQRLLSNRAVAYAGLVSYSLYLVHPYVYFVTRAVFVRVNLFTDDVLTSMTLFAAVTVLATLPVTHLAHILLERWPYERFFRQRVFRTEKTAVRTEVPPAAAHGEEVPNSALPAQAPSPR